MSLTTLQRWLTATVRRQLTLGMVLVVATTMSLFIVDRTRSRHDEVVTEQTDQASTLARNFATSAALWVASKDYGGLQGIIDSLASYPDLQHAIVLDLNGQVVAHSDTTRRGLFMADLPTSPTPKVLQRGAKLVDVVSPVVLAGQHIGWVRIGLSGNSLDAKLADMVQDGIIYAVIGIVLSAVIASLAGHYLTRRLNAIQKVADAVQEGQAGVRVTLDGDDEAAQLARRFNGMLDALDQREAALVHSHAALQQSEAGLLKLNASLEKRVHERTLALEQSLAGAEATTRAKSDFLANMSHEIRTPMNAILGMLQLMQRTALDKQQTDYINKTESAAKTLLGIINDILDFSKVEAGKMTLDLHAFEIDTLLRNMGVILSASVGSKDVEILFDIDPDLPDWVFGDALRLQQILINLAGNAIKFTRHGEVVLSVHMATAKNAAPRLAISVRDTGIGIASTQMERIFEGFSQAEASTTRRFGGTGLGLAISQRLVRLMGGELTAQSVVGAGSTFSFSIPFQAAESPAHAAPQAIAPLHGLRVLVVDDNASAREVMQSLLHSLGWQCDLAASGADALAQLKAQQQAQQYYDAVLIDWRMPDMDGWDTSLRIRALFPKDKVPLIVMVTAHAREAMAQRQAQLPSVLDGFLVKPVTASILFDAVADARAGQGHLVEPIVLKAVSALRLAGVRILVAEDNLINQQVAQELLGSEGALVTVAHNGLEAIAALQASADFDAVLMDIQMPDMDGYTATRDIRNRLGLRELPIIAMTANALPSDRAAAFEAGMNDHVAKPFDLTQLVQVIQQCMEQARGRGITPRPSSAPSVLDAKGALSRFGGNIALYQRVLRSFALEAMALAEQLPTLLSSDQADAARSALHTLKGLAATVGAQTLSMLAAQAENTAPGEWSALLAPLQEALAQSADAAHAQADRLQDPMESVAHTPSNTPMAVAELDALIVLLRQQNMDAIAVSASLTARYAPTMPNEFATLSDDMNRLDFEAALRCGLSMRQRLLSVG